MDREVSGPYRGAANNSAFVKTPNDLVPFSGIRNVRLYAPGTDRPRFGQRPGTRLRFERQLGTGSQPIQAFGKVRRASGISEYRRSDTPAAIMASDPSYVYSRLATPHARDGGSGNPAVCFVLAKNLSVDRCFGYVSDDGVTPSVLGGVPVPSLDRLPYGAEADYTPVAADILCVSGKYSTGSVGGFYDERAAADHQVIMGMQVAWHPDAGSTGPGTNQDTMIFTALIAPGTNTSGATNGSLYTSVTSVNVRTGAINWRNVCKDMEPVSAVDTAIRGTTAPIDDPGGIGIMARDEPINIISNHILVDTDYTYVSAGFFVYVFNTESGKYIQRLSVGAWSQEVQNVMIRRGLPRAYKNITPSTLPNALSPKALAINFMGTNADNTGFASGLKTSDLTYDGDMPADIDPARIQPLAHWRSGLAECSVFRNSDGTPIDTVGSTVLVRKKFPNKSEDYTPSEAVAETTVNGEHGTLRFSSILSRKPRGGIAYAACLGVDPVVGTSSPTTVGLAQAPFFIGITNRGYGVSSATPTAMTNANFGSAPGWEWPDSSTPPTTVAKIAADGRKVWEVDTQSLLDLYYQPEGWYNDIPIVNGAGGPEATVMGMTSDSAGDVYIVGRRNASASQPTAGFNVMKLDGDTGRIIWQQNVCGICYQHCVRISPVDGSVVVCGMRNDSWGDGGEYAFLWKLSPVDGAILQSFDLGLEETLWGTGDDTANNDWKTWCSGFSIDIDLSGRIAFASTPGV